MPHKKGENLRFSPPFYVSFLFMNVLSLVWRRLCLYFNAALASVVAWS